MDDHHTASSAQHADRSAEALRELKERVRTARAAQREQISQLERQLIEQLDMLSTELSKQQADEAAQVREELQQGRTTWHEERSQQEAELASLRDELDARGSELDARTSELDRRAAEIDELQRTQDERESQLAERESQLAERESQLAERESQLQARDDELAEREQQIAQTEQQTEADRQELAGRQQSWVAEQAQREAERDEVTAALAEAKERLELTQQQTDDAIENESLQHKFELALQDVRRLRGRVAELEQELARRPEADQADSAELVHLRAERDALAQRVEELEQAPAGKVEADTEQEVADLQRRFELAVEDLRDVKRKNAQLEAQLAETAKKVVSVADSGAMDWEAQKRRLLESLESEGTSDDPAREKERATIEGTIRITDEVVADKDEEIASLREQLSSFRSTGGKVAIDRERELAITRLVDEDEVIQQHRKRAAQIEQEIEEKLRAAEMELSVERAKIARQQAELAELRLELEAFNKSGAPPADQSSSSAPRRRWLSKLGLSGDDDSK